MIYKWLTPHVVLPLHDRLTGQYAWRNTKRLERLQWQSQANLEQRALDKLSPLLSHAYDNTEHYRQLMDRAGIEPRDIRSLADLTHLPLTSPQTVRERYRDRMLAKGVSPKRRVPLSTSGSSGLPLKFFTDVMAQASARSSLLYFRSLANVEIMDAELWIAIPAHMHGFFRDNPPLMRWARRRIMGEILVYGNGTEFGLDEFYRFVRGLPADRDYFILSYPSYLGILTQRILDSGGLEERPPQAVISHAETLNAIQAKSMERAFGCPVFDMYSCQEIFCMACTCPDNPGLMHINTERVWLRVVDEHGRDCPPGKVGRVVLTDLHNMVMPLINYEVGDLAVPGPPCSCGRGFPTLESVEGRSSQCVYTSSGKAVAPATFGRIVLNKTEFLPHIREYQARQTSLQQVTLYIVPTDKFNAQVKEAIQSNMRRYLGQDVEAEVKTVRRLQESNSGKRPLIISDLIEKPGLADLVWEK